MKTNKLYNTLVSAYAEDALNHAIAYLQEQLEIDSGDYASHFFSGENGDTIKRILIEYIKSEPVVTM